MALAVDTIFPVLEGDFVDLLVAATTTIYEGSAVYINSGGYAAPITGSVQKFVGFADRKADNSAGADGAIRVRVRRDEHVRQLPVTSVALTSVGAPVYASDDGTFTVTGTSSTSYIGRVVAYISAGVAQVLVCPFNPIGPRQADVGGAPSQSDFNTLLANLRLAGVINV